MLVKTIKITLLVCASGIGLETFCLQKTGKILRFLNPSIGKLAIVNLGFSSGLEKGFLISSYRKKPFGKNDQPRIKTGMLKVLKVSEHQSLAEIIVDGTDDSRHAFLDFPGVMAMDQVERSYVKV